MKRKKTAHTNLYSTEMLKRQRLPCRSFGWLREVKWFSGLKNVFEMFVWETEEKGRFKKAMYSRINLKSGKTELKRISEKFSDKQNSTPFTKGKEGEGINMR
jgi:hypothetical protein